VVSKVHNRGYKGISLQSYSFLYSLLIACMAATAVIKQSPLDLVATIHSTKETCSHFLSIIFFCLVKILLWLRSSEF